MQIEQSVGRVIDLGQGGVFWRSYKCGKSFCLPDRWPTVEFCGRNDKNEKWDHCECTRELWHCCS